MKISIITTVKNNKELIENCIQSVLNQTYKNIEYIVIDGASSDGTLEIINKYKARIARVISEEDTGVYNGINKGISLASGEIVGVLQSDDVYADEFVLEKVAEAFIKNNAECVYGDLEYVGRADKDRVIRYWKSQPYREGLFAKGWMPAHPAFFVKKAVYEKYGLFDTGLKIAADYEIMLRFLHKHKISAVYLDKVLVKMSWGGISNRNLLYLLRKSLEDYRVCRRYGLGVGTLFKKNIMKVSQFFRRKAEDQ